MEVGKGKESQELDAITMRGLSPVKRSSVIYLNAPLECLSPAQKIRIILFFNLFSPCAYRKQFNILPTVAATCLCFASFEC